ncbi:MAG: thermonuclease family protein [Nitrospira sp.]
MPKGAYRLTPRKHSSSFRSPATSLSPDRAVFGTHGMTVIDGDTLQIGAERIRLRGIDAPELNEPGGWAATQRLKELLSVGSIHLIPRGRDVYDRLVADVFVNGQNVAEILRSEGFSKTGESGIDTLHRPIQQRQE